MPGVSIKPKNQTLQDKLKKNRYQDWRVGLRQQDDNAFVDNFGFTMILGNTLAYSLFLTNDWSGGKVGLFVVGMGACLNWLSDSEKEKLQIERKIYHTLLNVEQKGLSYNSVHSLVAQPAPDIKDASNEAIQGLLAASILNYQTKATQQQKDNQDLALAHFFSHTSLEDKLFDEWQLKENDDDQKLAQKLYRKLTTIQSKLTKSINSEPILVDEDSQQAMQDNIQQSLNRLANYTQPRLSGQKRSWQRSFYEDEQQAQNDETLAKRQCHGG